VGQESPRPADVRAGLLVGGDASYHTPSRRLGLNLVLPLLCVGVWNGWGRSGWGFTAPCWVLKEQATGSFGSFSLGGGCGVFWMVTGLHGHQTEMPGCVWVVVGGGVCVGLVCWLRIV
jgi:hypothetical protein